MGQVPDQIWITTGLASAPSGTTSYPLLAILASVGHFNKLLYTNI
jgi:hypothetical protein